MADWDGLENRRARKGPGGSNPSPSARQQPTTVDPTGHVKSLSTPEFVRAATSGRVIAFIPIAKYHAYINAICAAGAHRDRLDTNSSIGVDFNEVPGP